MKRIAQIALVFMLAATAAGAGSDVERGPSPEVADENASPAGEAFRIRVVNRGNGPVEVSRDAGRTWVEIGRVVTPAIKVNPKGYTASKWAEKSAVCACAVNAIHVKVRNHTESGRGVIFSLAPAGDLVGATELKPGGTIVTDIEPGAGIFGGGLSPYVNSPVRIVREEIERLPADYVPSEGDELVIIVMEPPRAVGELIFENRFGGLITLRYVGGESKVIGCVLRPVVGVGRFPGTVDAAAGRIRANHPGVIDISTSPLGMVGGFQIVPKGHAESPEVYYVRRDTQWMVVGPVSALDPSWEGIAPLFSGYLAPNYRPDDLRGQHEDWMQRLLSRCLVQARIEEGPWQSLPRICIDPEAPERPRSTVVWRIKGSLDPYQPLAKEAYTALEGVTHIRILMPRAQYWP